MVVDTDCGVLMFQVYSVRDKGLVVKTQPGIDADDMISYCKRIISESGNALTVDQVIGDFNLIENGEIEI